MSTQKIKIGIIGLGMVGDPIRRWFEEHNGYKRGKDLFCYDADPKKGFHDDINMAEIVFIAVPTPSNPDGSCNTSIVESAASQIKDGKIIVVKSTVEPGTIERLQKRYPRKKFIFNPEFLTESQAWLDYIKPDRQIIGYTAQSRGDAKELLALLPKAHFERPWSSDYTKKSVNATEAELAKYASNVFGYIKVIYGNILADICYALEQNFKKQGIKTEVSYENVREAISADSRIGPAWLNIEHGDYCGSGGYCFPKDMTAFIKFGEKMLAGLAKDKRTEAGLIKALKKGIAVLQSIHEYNKTLLAWQGLTLADVSRHDKEIMILKRKKIRQS